MNKAYPYALRALTALAMAIFGAVTVVSSGFDFSGISGSMTWFLVFSGANLVCMGVDWRGVPTNVLALAMLVVMAYDKFGNHTESWYINAGLSPVVWALIVVMVLDTLIMWLWPLIVPESGD